MNATMGLLASGASPATLSLRSVARAAHVTAPAIYPHFSGMDDLLSAVVTRRFAEFTAVLDGAAKALPPAHTPQDELIARVTAYCQFGLERPGDYELLFGRGEAYGGVPYENSAGQQAFTNRHQRQRGSPRRRRLRYRSRPVARDARPRLCTTRVSRISVAAAVRPDSPSNRRPRDRSSTGATAGSGSSEVSRHRAADL